MENSRLLKIFQHLTKKELRELGKFVRSPFHNQRTDVILLYEYLIKALKKPEKSQLKKIEVFPHIFPDEPYIEKKIRYTMSFLYQAIKAFLAYQTYASDPVNQQLLIVQALRKKKLGKLFEQEFRIASNLLDQQPFRNANFHFQNYQLQQERYLETMSQTRGTALGLETASKHFDDFFIAIKLKQSTHALAHQTLQLSSFRPQWLPEVLNHLSQKTNPSSPAISIYYQCLKMLIETDTLPYFQQFRQLIEQHSHCFPKSELKDLYIFALNYCIKRLNAREDFFKREAFELYKTGIEQAIFFENGSLSRFTYKNMVAIALGLKEYNWVARFIENYKPFLEKKYRESTYCFNLALLHYKQENYSKAMELLQKVSTSDVLNNLNARRMLARIYYDQGDLEPLYSLLDSFQNYIYRKKDLGYHRDLYLNFIRFTRRLLQAEGYAPAQLQNLVAEIEATRNVAEKDWLLEQLAPHNRPVSLHKEIGK